MLNTLLIVILSFGTPDTDTLTHKVMRYYSDGQARVEYCYIPGTQKLAKEIVYFRDGIVDYTGEYKNGTEHGTWTYYWPSGIIRAQEFYVKGLENGTMFDYNEKGEPIIEYIYKMGTLISRTEM